MLKISLKWGGISGGIMVALLLISHFLFPTTDPAQFDAAEIYGYAAMVASLAILYMAILEMEKSGSPGPSQWQKILACSGAAVVAGFIFGLYNVFYTSVLNPEFLDTYYDYYISQLPVQSGPDYEEKVAALEADKAMFMSPLTQFLVMGATVVAIGIPMSVLLAFLRRLKS